MIGKLVEGHRSIGINTFFYIQVLHNRNQNIGLIILQVYSNSSKRPIGKTAA